MNFGIHTNAILGLLETLEKCLLGHVYVVGGAVRDAILGNYAFSDIDLVADCAYTEREFKTLSFPYAYKEVCSIGGLYLQFNVPGLPFCVQLSFLGGKSIEANLSERDFTANAIAYSLGSGVLDPFGGVADLTVRVVRPVVSVESSFVPDVLRVIRGLSLLEIMGTGSALSDDFEAFLESSLFEDLLKGVNDAKREDYLVRYLTRPILEQSKSYAGFAGVAKLFCGDLPVTKRQWDSYFHSFEPHLSFVSRRYLQRMSGRKKDSGYFKDTVEMFTVTKGKAFVERLLFMHTLDGLLKRSSMDIGDVRLALNNYSQFSYEVYGDLKQIYVVSGDIDRHAANVHDVEREIKQLYLWNGGPYSLSQIPISFADLESTSVTLSDAEKGEVLRSAYMYWIRRGYVDTKETLMKYVMRLLVYGMAD